MDKTLDDSVARKNPGGRRREDNTQEKMMMMMMVMMIGNTDAAMHVHAHLCTVVYIWSWYIPGLVHDLAQYRALERTQWEVQLMVQLLGYREIVSTE